MFYHTATMDDVMDSFTRWPVEERLYRMEMLAELYYAETAVKTGPMRQLLLERAMQMFVFIDRNSRTYSFDRQAKISRIQALLDRPSAADNEPFAEKNERYAEENLQDSGKKRNFAATDSYSG